MPCFFMDNDQLTVYMNKQLLSIGAWIPSTKVLGPGNRFALWLQGCPFNCPGCGSPGFGARIVLREVAVSDMLEFISKTKDIQGITVSGGEPVMQAESLAPFLRAVKNDLNLSAILYSGYYLKELQALGSHRPAVREVLKNIDVLIDGRYEHELNNSKGLRGSTNQTVYFLTDRYKLFIDDFKTGTRRQEMHSYEDAYLLVGLPTLKQWRHVAMDPTGRNWYNVS